MTRCGIRQPRKKPSKQVFANTVVVLSGDFGHGHDHVRLGKWINEHGGQVEKDVTEQTTHLVCSIADYKAKVGAVRKALELGIARCKIVTYDFIEDSLIGKGAPKIISHRFYQLHKTLARIRRGEKEKARHVTKYIEDINSSKELADPLLYHHYIDSTFFTYKVILTRIDKGLKGLKLERYTIYLFQSNATPCTYKMGAKYTQGHRPISFYRSRCIDKEFSAAFADFKWLFELKTGIPWDRRLEKLPQPDDAFVYTPPAGGRPRGELPREWKELGSEQKSEGGGSTTETGDESRSGKAEEDEDDVMADTDSSAGDGDSDGEE